MMICADSVTLHCDGIIGGSDAEGLWPDYVISGQRGEVRFVERAVVTEIDGASRYSAAACSGINYRELSDRRRLQGWRTAFLRQKPDGMNLNIGPMRGVELLSAELNLICHDCSLARVSRGLPYGNVGLPPHQNQLLPEDHRLEHNDANGQATEYNRQKSKWDIVWIGGLFVLFGVGWPLIIFFAPARFLLRYSAPGRDVLPMRGVRSKRDKEQQ